MQQAVSARAPVHLWIVGILALLWNGFGCYQYLMTTLRDPAFMAQIPADQVTYMESLPAWVTGCWAIGVWGGLAGAILLLMRNRYAVWAFAVSLIGAVAGLGYQMFMTSRPASMTEGAMGLIPWAIILFAAFLWWYASSAQKKGALR
ncbi:MAG TPA: hypothetical protein VJM15_08000 [Sphingomicrobium sp.]|nr:hypothetical protein [Sphingomicrobium sp.]